MLHHIGFTELIFTADRLPASRGYVYYVQTIKKGYLQRILSYLVNEVSRVFFAFA